MKILMTSGPTREPIDSVRYISNLSSGETGRFLGNYFFEKGFDVVSLYGLGSARPEKVPRTLEFNTFNDLDLQVKKVLSEEDFDVVIHLAAVSDYSVVNSAQGKVESLPEELTLKLKRNFKILNRIKEYSKSERPFVIGFKLTDNLSEETWLKAVKSIYERGNVDLVVHNDLSDYDKDSKKHRFRIVDLKEKVVECRSVTDLAQELEKLMRRL